MARRKKKQINTGKLNETKICVYRGWITEGRSVSNYDHSNALSLEPIEHNKAEQDSELWRNTSLYDVSLINEALAYEIERDILRYGNLLTVRYFITTEACTLEEAEEAFLESLFGFHVGESKARFNSHYSEYTGYLWTDEDIVIGGHDLIQELRSHVGKFCCLQITYFEEE